MFRLDPDKKYRIIEVAPESNYVCHKEKLEGSEVTLTADDKQLSLPAKEEETTRHYHHARVKIVSGKLYGRVILLTYFSVQPVDHQECMCEAYNFPHAQGEGKCQLDAPDEHGYKAWCGYCKKSCIPTYRDEGIGWTQMGSHSMNHQDWVYRSDCCEDAVYGNPQCTKDFEPEVI